MSIRCDEYNGVCLLTVDGDLSGDAVNAAQRDAETLLARHERTGVVFDLEECDFIDSAGLEMLCRLRRRCESAGKRLTLARVRTNCAKILEVTRLATQFDRHADLSAALAAAR